MNLHGFPHTEWDRVMNSLKRRNAQMTPVEYLKWAVEEDGLDYAIRHKSDFSDVEDSRFQELKQQYKEAARELEQYIEEMQ